MSYLPERLVRMGSGSTAPLSAGLSALTYLIPLTTMVSPMEETAGSDMIGPENVGDRVSKEDSTAKVDRLKLGADELSDA